MPSKLLSKILCLLLALAIAPVAWAVDYYVSTAGNDSTRANLAGRTDAMGRK